MLHALRTFLAYLTQVGRLHGRFVLAHAGVWPKKKKVLQTPHERCALCRFDDYLAQAVTAYTGTRILAHAGGLPKEKEDKQAMATLFEVRMHMVQTGGCAGRAYSTPARCYLCTSASFRVQTCHASAHVCKSHIA